MQTTQQNKNKYRNVPAGQQLDKNTYEVVGGRRLRAAKLAQLDAVPVRVVQLSDLCRMLLEGHCSIPHASGTAAAVMIHWSARQSATAWMLTRLERQLRARWQPG